MARLIPFCNLTNFYFLISPTDYERNLTEEKWGCFKHIGMDYNMFMSMPIQERRAFIHKHNQEQEMLERRYEKSNGSDTRTYEGESINTFARMEQTNGRFGQR